MICTSTKSLLQEHIRSIYPTCNPQPIFQIIEDYVDENHAVAKLFVRILQYGHLDNANPLLLERLQNRGKSPLILDLSNYHFTLINSQTPKKDSYIFVSPESSLQRMITYLASKKYFPRLQTILLPKSSDPDFDLTIIEKSGVKASKKVWENVFQGLKESLDESFAKVQSNVKVKFVIKDQSKQLHQITIKFI